MESHKVTQETRSQRRQPVNAHGKPATETTRVSPTPSGTFHHTPRKRKAPRHVLTENMQERGFSEGVAVRVFGVWPGGV